jgi:hypothetical protein
MGCCFELLSPLIIKDFALDIPTYRSGFQIWLSLGITGLHVRPWLADRFGRRRAFALAFLTIPVFMTAMAVGVWFLVPEHAGKELNAIVA